ncbi:hypothetical protein SYNPS1DRAFT_28715 [Syncephalis pseudoplumigaleata]|uniref:Uncharacterized protein n=1 Tax=Syncephalis pseudoplumigaleata TaxID=1712513 RepID=A0A4P9YZM3_9FUNG|nr:hypothetical protein SYNPS1DRAFT_28715 [Syncephalis pseudoplumigaleata]|eukprot:RKP25554.1 hypothetical protein SYNPS1DRAFT_28715 [Syncephalis pseudoplumigaleata]
MDSMALSQPATTKVLQTLADLLVVKASQPPGQIVGAGLRSKQELLAITVHAILVLGGFRFIAAGEQATAAASSPSTEQAASLSSGWNSESTDSWTFQYVRPDTQHTLVVKCVVLFDNLLVTGTTLETSKVATLELQADQYVDKQVVYPITTLPAPDAEDGGFGGLFTSEQRLQQLIGECMNELAIIGMDARHSEHKAGSIDVLSVQEAGSSRQPRPPSYDELYQRGDLDSSWDTAANPYNIGAADLDPLAASPMAGGPGGLRLPGRGGGSGGGGMHVGPEHPIFRPDTDMPPDHGRGAGIFGGPQPLPRGSVPPGARFDPIGPFGPDPSAPPRPGRGRGGFGGGFGGGGGGPFSGDPDNDELPPPSDNAACNNKRLLGANSSFV